MLTATQPFYFADLGHLAAPARARRRTRRARCRKLQTWARHSEENSLRGRTADFTAFLAFGMSCTTQIAPFVDITFASSLTFTTVVRTP